MQTSEQPTNLPDDETGNQGFTEWTGDVPSKTNNTAFFYGTLMHPKVIQKVIEKSGDHLEICIGLLLGYTRHHVKDGDYPAIVPSSVSQDFINAALTPEERSVRGVIVRGLTAEDIACLDIFEGNEYVREQVRPHPLSKFAPLSDAPTASVLSTSTPLSDLSSLPAPIKANVYVWSAPTASLKPEIWSFDTFVREKLHLWVGKDADNNPDYLEVDRRRNMQGKIIGVIPEGGEGKVNIEDTSDIKFGHPMKKYFGFAESYVNLNNGSYGATPLPVLKYVQEISDLSEARPDLFFRKTYLPLLTKARERLAKLIGADTDECVIVPNTTHGVNTVLRNFDWQEGDIIVGFSTTYGAVQSALQYISDVPPNPTLSMIQLTFPTSHAEILKTFRAHLQSLDSDDFDQKVVVVIDSIVSNPGVRLPWEEMVQICKEERVWSLVDAAHAIGQTEVNLSKTQPDFWVSNCHKWLMSKRGSSVLYVPKRNQHVIKSTLPTSVGYVSPRKPPATKPTFGHLFEWTGTQDFAPFLSINAGLDFRESIGGEKKIQAYCNELAKVGGARMAEILGTSVMESNGELTTHMVNVLLPLPVTPNSTHEDEVKTWHYLQDSMLDKHDCFAAVYMHDRKWWTRASAQVWNEISDFEYVANALKDICREAQSSS